MAGHRPTMRDARLLAGLVLVGVLACRDVPASTERQVPAGEASLPAPAVRTATRTAEPDVETPEADDDPAGAKPLTVATADGAPMPLPSPLQTARPTLSPEPALPPSYPATPSPTHRAMSTTALVQQPLRDLSREAAEYLATRGGSIGVAVVVPGQGRMYTANGDEPFPMASVAKVAIMVTVLDRAIREGRDPTARELALLEPMITLSDNDAATNLWVDVGGAEAVEAYLGSIGLTAIRPNAQGCWGGSRAPASEVALLLAKLVVGEILDEPSRRLAIELMGRVDPAQTWGVTSGIPDQPPPGTTVGIKDGWYPAGCGWWVNSAGFVIPGDEKPAYTIAVLTREQDRLETGVTTIEELARHIHAALHGT